MIKEYHFVISKAKSQLHSKLMHTGDPPPGTHHGCRIGCTSLRCCVHGGHRMYVTGAGSYFLLIIPLCARGTFLVHGVTVTMGGEFGCLIVLITPLGRVGRRNVLETYLSVVSPTDWQG